MVLLVVDIIRRFSAMSDSLDRLGRLFLPSPFFMFTDVGIHCGGGGEGLWRRSSSLAIGDMSYGIGVGLSVGRFHPAVAATGADVVVGVEVGLMLVKIEWETLIYMN